MDSLEMARISQDDRIREANQHRISRRVRRQRNINMDTRRLIQIWNENR